MSIHTLKRVVTKTALLYCMAALVVTQQSGALYNDAEQSRSNVVASTTLNLSLTSPTPDFAPGGLLAGDAATRNARVENVGQLPLDYSLQYHYTSGSVNLCSSLTLKVWYNSILQYTGPLQNFSIPGPATLTNFHDYTFEVTLPADADFGIINQTCGFSIHTDGWQPELGYGGGGFTDTEVLAGTITTGDWSQPICRTIAGYKKNQLDQTGIGNWPIVIHPTAAAPLESLTVSANDTSGETTTNTLQSNKTYLIEVTGTWTNRTGLQPALPLQQVDAQYYSQDSWSTQHDYQTTDGVDPRLIELTVNNQNVEWGSYNTDHRYKLIMKGTGSPVQFAVAEPGDPSPPTWHQDNSGSLSVAIYDVTNEIATTDSTGHYQKEICGHGQYQVIEVPSLEWFQTEPNHPSYYHGNFTDEVGEYNFTNASSIVLNEIMYDVSGDEGGPKPAGEWVELYNLGTTGIDLNNWQIKDAASNTITISTGNSDANGNPLDAGETTIPSHGYLVVYRNSGTGMFNNDGDTVTLVDTSGVKRDAHTYAGGKAEDATEARSTDGTGAWVDPIATPGRPNIININQLDPKIKLFAGSDNTVTLILSDALNYTQVSYTITYTHQVDGQTQEEVITGSQPITTNTQYMTDLYMGTCSSGGMCTSHEGVGGITAAITLTGGGGLPDRQLSANLTE